ncbi:hypothetical protein ABZT28_50250 [Streptomyces sp. NPDC005388]|uniref:hypothetical protein n=1 Tax=Streptomyces sp. NPDC005388 TaxID=3156717 RepID=UPI0033BC8A59
MTVAPDVNVVQPDDEDFWQPVVSRGGVTILPRWSHTPVENIGVFDLSPDNAATLRCCLDQSGAVGHITVHDNAGEVIRLSPFGLGALDLGVGKYVYDKVADSEEPHVVDDFFHQLNRYG